MALFSTLATAIYFIACHGGPADHFSTFAEELANRGHEVQIYATGPALKKFRDRNIETAIPFSLENGADELAANCSGASVVITDIGHPFDVSLQKALQNRAPSSLRLAYYDNPEPYVPGGYSSVAAQAMLEADATLFANGNLVKMPLYKAPFEEVNLPAEKRIGLGYYPIDSAAKLAQRRVSEKSQIRAQIFSKYALIDEGQTLLVYMGGNNEEYFSKAFPAFLQFLGEVSQQNDFVVLLQQHPGAKEKNLDGNAPRCLISEMSTDDVLVASDAVLYYQTSMGPQFVLAGIPAIQVGHAVYEDILVKNGLCAVATDANGLLHAITHLRARSDDEAIQRGLGLRVDWATRLEEAVR